MAINNKEYFIEKVLDFIEQTLGSRDVMGLWLTTFENVIDIYDGKPENIDEYILQEEYVVISDLGCDGALFVFNNEKK